MDKWFFIKKIWQHLLPVVPLMFLMSLTYLVLFDQPNYTPDYFQKMFYVVGECSLALSAVVAAYVEAQYAARRGFEKRLARGAFKGISKKSRLFSDAMECIRCRELAEGVDLLKSVLECKCTDREKAVASFYIGNTYRLMGHHTNAANYLKDAIELGLNDKDHMVNILLARCYTENGSYKEAIGIYEELIKKDALIEYLYTDYGMCFLAMSDYERALACFVKAVENNQNYVFALGGCSLALLGQKDIEHSRVLYAKALAANMADVAGFKQYYCKIAESVGVYDKIDEEMKISF